MSEDWWSIEVLDGAFPAARWKDAHSAALIEAALSHGARDWGWSEHRWGVVFEVAWADSDQWASFRALPAVTAALDAVPNPVHGLLIYQGRGGSSASGQPRRPRPQPAAGAAELPTEPPPVLVARLDQAAPVLADLVAELDAQPGRRIAVAEVDQMI